MNLQTMSLVTRPGRRSGLHRGPALAVAALVVISLLFGGSVAASGQISARSMAMGGAYLGLAQGVDAARYNPANLGLVAFRSSGLRLVGVGLHLNNNSLSLDDYNRYTGAVLTTSDKQDILGKIPSEGLRVVADVEATAMAVSAGPWVLCATGIGVADINLNRDIMDLVLNGNHLGQTVNVTGSYGDAIAYVQSSLSYGRAVYQSGTRQLALGISLKHLYGIAVEQVTELEGGVSTLATGITGAGRMRARTSTGGNGYGLDLGAALALSDDYTCGLALRNALGSISWNRRTEEHGYLFDFDTSATDILQDNYVVSDDYTKDISGFSTRLPAELTVGVANVSGDLVWAIDWQQSLNEGIAGSTKPRLMTGLEYRGLPVIPLRLGFATGGSRGTHFSTGSGLRLAAFYVDFAVEGGASVSPYSSRGLNLAVTTGLDF